MQNRVLLYLILIIIGIGIIGIMKFMKNEVKQDFSIQDIDSISKIVLSDKKGTNITLKKGIYDWYVNDTYKVRYDAIQSLLSTINKIELKRTVPKSKLNSVVTNLATKGVTINIYTKNKHPEKKYIIGGNTPDHLGTYMILDDSHEPVITHIPGFHGFLSPRYGIQADQLNLNTWRSTKVFALNKNHIKEISLYHFNKPEESFTLSGSPLSLKDNNGNIVNLDNARSINFFNVFSKLHCQSFSNLDKRYEKEIDKLHRLVITHNEGKDTLLTYSREQEIDTLSQKPNVKTMYATLNNGEFMIIQSYVFNKVLITINELRK